MKLAKRKTIDAKDIGKRQAIYSEWRDLANSLKINFKSREHVYDSLELAEIANKDKVNHLKKPYPVKRWRNVLLDFQVAHHAERAAIMDLTKAKEVFTFSMQPAMRLPPKSILNLENFIDRGIYYFS